MKVTLPVGMKGFVAPRPSKKVEDEKNASAFFEHRIVRRFGSVETESVPELFSKIGYFTR
jgi:hypothetical protein